MEPITCSRCKKTTERMPALPFPGDLGARVQAHVCAPCWKEWLSLQVNIINENRYVMTNAEHRAILTRQMLEFLELSPGD
jgi:Fe-S cluster biosynthesis and repair protein YggX